MRHQGIDGTNWIGQWTWKLCSSRLETLRT